MADTFTFELVSPERLLFSGEATQVVVPGSEGDFTVLPNHAPVMSTLKPGVLLVSMRDAGDSRIFVRGGFAEVGPTNLTVLAEQAIPLAELDGAAIAAELKNAEDDVNDARSDAARNRAQERLDQLKQLQATL